MEHSLAIGSTQTLLLIAAVLVMLLMFAIWAVRRRSKARATLAWAPAPLPAGSHSEMQRAPYPAPSEAARPSVPMATDVPEPAFAPQPRVSPPASPPAQGSPDSTASFAADIARCEAGGDKTELANLYIKQAVVYVSAGLKDDAAARLRDAIRVAALNRLTAPHALARVELGDLYLSNGDPITACEQWQIARNLFHDLAQPADRDNVDKRMLGNGCPTDWVLTDF